MSKINGQFIAHRVDMLKSPAFGAMSLSARRVLDCLEVEHGKTGGKNNGSLISPHRHFVAFGIAHRLVPAAVREVEALGFVAVNRGSGGTGNHKAPNTYRLTYLHAAGKAPTDEWRRITTKQQADETAAAARKATAKNSFHRHHKVGVAPPPQSEPDASAIRRNARADPDSPPPPQSGGTI